MGVTSGIVSGPYLAISGGPSYVDHSWYSVVLFLTLFWGSISVVNFAAFFLPKRRGGGVQEGFVPFLLLQLSDIKGAI